MYKPKYVTCFRVENKIILIFRDIGSHIEKKEVESAQR